MSKVKDLLQAIISEEGYNEAFKAVMAEKIYMRLEEKKLLVAQSIFEEKCCSCDEPQKTNMGKCSICSMPIRNAKDPEGVPEEKWKAFNEDWGSYSKSEFKRREMEHEHRHEDDGFERRRLAQTRKSRFKPMSIGQSTTSNKIYHSVPYAKKDEAKKEGMRFDGEKKKWYHTDSEKSKKSAFAVHQIKEDVYTKLEERELSAEEMKKREKYVLSMKKNMADFEKRYGSRAKEVMYATATKMAKGEMKDSVEIEEFLYSLDEKFEKERVDYFKPEESKVAGKRYSEVASALKQKRQKPLLKATPSGMIKSSFEDSSDLIDEELKGNQHKLDVDQDGEIEAEDLAKLRAKKKKKANDKV